MAQLLRDPLLLVKLSVFISLLQPLRHIRMVQKAIDSWNPVHRAFDVLGISENERRIDEADRYFKYLTPISPSTIDHEAILPLVDEPSHRWTIDSQTLDIVISIVTVNRPSGRYLIQAAARMLELTQTDDCCFRKLMFICNVDDNYERHTDAVYLKQYMNYIDKSGKSNFRLPHVQRQVRVSATEPKDTRRRKEIEDYLFCVNVSMSLNPRYVLMLEDDIIPHPDLFPVIKLALNSTGQLLGHETVRGDIQHLKLFSFDHLSNLQDYAIRVLRNVSLVVLCGILGLLVKIAFSNQTRYSFELHSLIFARGLLVGSIIVFCFGNNFYLEIYRVSPELYTFEPLQRSSSAALVFKTDMLDGLVDYFMYRNSGVGPEGHKDLAIDTYIHSNGLHGHLIKPYLIEHIGEQSSLRC